MRPVLLTVLLLFVVSQTLAQPSSTFQTEAVEGILMDVESGAVLFEKQADKLFAPASMSKVMTLALLFKKLKAGEISLETEFPVSLNAWKTGGAPSRTSAMFIPLNTTAKVGELIQGIAVQNGNDACIAVAEGLAGTEDSFAQMMTDEARAIGLEKSTFGNSSGLPHPANLMTARELAKLAIYVIHEYPEQYSYFAQKDFKYRVHNFVNLNPLLAANIGADGLKIGFTEGAGYGIVASAVKDGRRLVMVLNGFEKEKDRKEDSTKLLAWGFTNFKAYKVFNSGDVVGEARIWGSDKRHISLKTKSDIKILLPVAAKDQRIKAQIVYKGPLKPPVKDGDKVAEVRITSEAGTSNAAPLYAAEDMQPAGMVTKGIDSLVFLTFGWIL